VNPCLADELALAQKIAGQNVSLYINAANPDQGLDQSRKYAEQVASQDAKSIREAEKTAKLKVAIQPLVWIDVEGANTWQEGVTDAQKRIAQSYNAAAGEGMVIGFRRAGLGAGIYSAETTWHTIMGTVSPKSDLNTGEWLAPGGVRACSLPTLIAGGSVALGQTTEHYPPNSGQEVDTDYGCKAA